MELRHEAGMVERLFFFGAQVRFGTRHPEQIAMQEHFLTAQRVRVIPNQTFQC